MTSILKEKLPSQNPNTGRSVTIATKAPPELLSAVVEVVNRDRSPYESVSAFVRSAIHRLILELSADSDGSLLPGVVALLNEWSRQEFEFHTHEQVVEGMKNNAHMLEVYVDGGDVARASETLEEICKDILNLKDDFWKRLCLRELWKFTAAKDALKMAGDRAPSAIAAYGMWKEQNREK